MRNKETWLPERSPISWRSQRGGKRKRSRRLREKGICFSDDWFVLLLSFFSILNEVVDCFICELWYIGNDNSGGPFIIPIFDHYSEKIKNSGF